MELEDALTRFALGYPEPLAETGAARLWRVRAADGAPRVLKLYRRGHAGNEAAGAALMEAWRAAGAPIVRVHARDADALVLDWIDGPLLGDRARAADLSGADRCLARLAARLHSAVLPPLPGLPLLEDWFTALFDLRFDDACPQGLRRDMGRAAGMARDLLATQDRLRPLHGDLHHDNVLCGPTTTAIDAKGVLGDAAYELANAMRNPRGCAGLDDPATIARRLRLFSQALEVDESRLARWSAAKCALSIAWRGGPVLSRDREAGTLSALLSACAA